MRYNIELGDWSGDGHGIYHTFHVEVPEMYDLEQLKYNYTVNVKELGFDPHKHIAVEYDEPSIEPEYLKALEDDDFEIPDFDLEGQTYRGTIYIDPEQYLAIVMYFFGRGLAHFNWHYVPDETPNLYRGGYGLYTQ